MTPDEHAAEAERILTSVTGTRTDGPSYSLTAAVAALAVAQVHATLSTRPVALEPVTGWATTTAPPPPAGYQRATTATGYAIWQHQLSDDGETCMQVKSSRYFPSNRLSANGEAPPEYCACQGRDTRTDPGTWLPVYTPTTET